MSVFTWNITSSAVTYRRPKGNSAPAERKYAFAILNYHPASPTSSHFGPAFLLSFLYSSVVWCPLPVTIAVCGSSQARSAGLSQLWVGAAAFLAEGVCLGSALRVAWLLSCPLVFVLCPPSLLFLRFLHWFQVRLFWTHCSFLVY